MKSLALIGAVIATLAGAAGLALGGASPSQTSASATGRVSPARAVGAVPGGERVRFTLVLRLPHAGSLQATLDAIDDPRSPDFHHFIAPAAFGRRFGLSDLALRGLTRWLRAHGVTVETSYPQRTALGVSARAATVSRLFTVRLISYRGTKGELWHAPDHQPTSPRALRSTVTGVTGLDTRPALRAWDVPGGSLTPPLLQRAYDLAPLRRLGLNGSGQSIAVTAFSDYDHTDPGGYAQAFGLGGPAPHVIAVRGGTTDPSQSDEVNLDIDIVRAVAPGAQILLYQGGTSDSSYTDVLNRIVKDGRTKIISTSWGECESREKRAELDGDSKALASARAAGISVFAASGDAGAYDCQGRDASDLSLSVDWPASSRNAIAVGGTRLDLTAGGSYIGEAAWNDPLSAGGGGGGFSRLSARPRWQVAPGIPHLRFRGRRVVGARGVPDVSAAADPGTGWTIYWNGALADGFGGTSAAAPFWAASMLLIEQYTHAHRVGALGDVAPLLYALASRPQPFAPFHDVTFGSNRYYAAGRGWDPATGLGSPDVYNLARDIVAHARRARR